MKFNLGSDRIQAYIRISLIYSYFNLYDLRIFFTLISAGQGQE